MLTDAGYALAGRKRPAQPEVEGFPVRPCTKLAVLVMTLRRPQGATKLHPHRHRSPSGKGRPPLWWP